MMFPVLKTEWKYDSITIREEKSLLSTSKNGTTCKPAESSITLHLKGTFVLIV